MTLPVSDKKMLLIKMLSFGIVICSYKGNITCPQASIVPRKMFFFCCFVVFFAVKMSQFVFLYLMLCIY